jgi:hypothetical protein
VSPPRPDITANRRLVPKSALRDYKNLEDENLSRTGMLRRTRNFTTNFLVSQNFRVSTIFPPQWLRSILVLALNPGPCSPFFSSPIPPLVLLTTENQIASNDFPLTFFALAAIEDFFPTTPKNTEKRGKYFRLQAEH